MGYQRRVHGEFHLRATMRAAILLAVVAVATGAPKLSKKGLSTPLARGGGKIVGGTEASPGEFPHQIVLLRGGVGGSLMCGGSLVAENMVVTAGHCCDGQSASRLGIRVGNHHLYEDDPDQMDFAVKNVMLHENYDSWTINNDIFFWRLTAWPTSAAPTSGPSACHLTERSTQQELTAPCLDGEPPQRAAAWARS